MAPHRPHGPHLRVRAAARGVARLTPRRARAAATAALLLAGACAPAAAPSPAATPAPEPPRAALRRLVDSLVADPVFATARWGVLVVNPATGDTLYSRDAGKLFMPASNQKIVTGSVGLALLGPEYRWRTTLAARGPVRGGVLEGDLVVIGRGDPTVSDHMRGDALAPLREAADSLRARGITRITGRVVAEGDAFADAPWGYGWGWDDFDAPYSAGIDELLFNEGISRVVVRAGARPGDAPTVTAFPVGAVPPLRTEVVTVTPGIGGGATATRVEPRFDAATGNYVLGGVVSVNDSAVINIAHRDANGAYVAALAQALVERGIALGARLGDSAASKRATPARGAASARRPAPPAPRPPAADTPLDTLFVIASPPLRDALAALEKPSQNQMAEALFKTIALERTGVGTADSARAVIGRQLRAWGVQPERDAVVRDGSGLSRHDYVTPEALVRILSAMRTDTAFRAFYDALPVAGVDGTIANRMKNTPAQGNVRAKTGFVDKARSLSGYVTTADGELLVFSFLCNNFTVPTREVERVQDAVAARLASLRWRDLAADRTAAR